MLVVGALLGVGIFFVGCKKFFVLKQKKLFFDNFLSFLNGLSTQVMFFQSKLNEIFGNTNFSSNFNYFLQNCKNFIFGENKKDFLLYLNSVNYFDKNEQNYVVDFFEKLGKTDVDSVCDLVKKFSIFINNKLKSENENFRQKGKLTLSLSAMLGLFVFIVIW